MKRMAKKNFISNSKNVFLALLIVAAAVTVYGIAQAATVSHTPGQIIPQGPGSGFDSDTLWGLTSADILSAVGGGGGGGGQALVTWGVGAETPGSGAPACPSGWTLAYSGYGPFLSSSTTAATAASDVCSTSSALVYFLSGTGGVSVSACSGSCNTCNVCVKSETFLGGRPSAGITMLYFTKNSYNGDLGGRSGADSKCTNELPSELSGKVTNIHAFLSTAANDEIRDMHMVDSDNDGTAKNYYETAKEVYGYNRWWAKWTQLARDWKDLLDGPLPVTMSEATGGLATYYWTGSYYEGAIDNTGRTCSGWTSTSSSTYGQVGQSGSAYNWLWLNANQPCDGTLPMICAAKYTG